MVPLGKRVESIRWPGRWSKPMPSHRHRLDLRRAHARESLPRAFFMQQSNLRLDDPGSTPVRCAGLAAGAACSPVGRPQKRCPCP